MSSTHDRRTLLARDLSLGAALTLAAACLGCTSPSPRRAPYALDVHHAEAPGGTDSLPPDEPARSRRQEADPDAGYKTAFFAANGPYLCARTHWSRLGGDFDGDTALSGPDMIFLPEAEDGLGYELALGWMSAGWAMELAYTRITYDGSIDQPSGTRSADIDYQAISWNGMRYLRANEALQPYWLFGLVFPWMELDDASTSDGVAFGDAELTNGLGLSGGLGLAWRLGPHLALDLRSLFTYQFFEEAEGVTGNSGTIDDGVDGPSFGLSLGLTWVLGKQEGGGS